MIISKSFKEKVLNVENLQLVIEFLKTSFDVNISEAGNKITF